MKAEESNQRDTVREQESRLGKLARCLPPSSNSIIPHRVILKYPYAYQAHLERISDFLLCGEGIWWRHILSGIEFLDSPEESNSRDNGPPLHHFRTHTVKSENQYLRDCWKQCLTHQVSIPHHALRIYDEDGNLESINHTGFFEDTDDNGSDDERIEDDDTHKTGTRNGDSYDVQQDDGDDSVVDLQQVGEDLMEPAENEPLGDCEFPSAKDVTIPLNESVTAEMQPSLSPISSRASAKSHKLQSTLAKNVCKVLGQTEEVTTLDKSRNKLRDNLNSKEAQENYEAALAAIQTQVLAKHSSIKRQFKEWETSFFTEHECTEPTTDDIRNDGRAHHLYKTLRLCKQLLQHWSITIHL